MSLHSGGFSNRYRPFQSGKAHALFTTSFKGLSPQEIDTALSLLASMGKERSEPSLDARFSQLHLPPLLPFPPTPPLPPPPSTLSSSGRSSPDSLLYSESSSVSSSGNTSKESPSLSSLPKALSSPSDEDPRSPSPVSTSSFDLPPYSKEPYKSAQAARALFESFLQEETARKEGSLSPANSEESMEHWDCFLNEAHQWRLRQIEEQNKHERIGLGLGSYLRLAAAGVPTLPLSPIGTLQLPGSLIMKMRSYAQELRKQDAQSFAVRIEMIETLERALFAKPELIDFSKNSSQRHEEYHYLAGLLELAFDYHQEKGTLSLLFMEEEEGSLQDITQSCYSGWDRRIHNFLPPQLVRLQKPLLQPQETAKRLRQDLLFSPIMPHLLTVINGGKKPSQEKLNNVHTILTIRQFFKDDPHLGLFFRKDQLGKPQVELELYEGIQQQGIDLKGAAHQLFDKHYNLEKLREMVARDFTEMAHDHRSEVIDGFCYCYSQLLQKDSSFELRPAPEVEGLLERALEVHTLPSKERHQALLEINQELILQEIPPIPLSPPSVQDELQEAFAEQNPRLRLLINAAPRDLSTQELLEYYIQNVERGNVRIAANSLEVALFSSPEHKKQKQELLEKLNALKEKLKLPEQIEAERLCVQEAVQEIRESKVPHAYLQGNKDAFAKLLIEYKTEKNERDQEETTMHLTPFGLSLWLQSQDLLSYNEEALGARWSSFVVALKEQMLSQVLSHEDILSILDQRPEYVADLPLAPFQEPELKALIRSDPKRLLAAIKGEKIDLHELEQEPALPYLQEENFLLELLELRPQAIHLSAFASHRTNQQFLLKAIEVEPMVLKELEEDQTTPLFQNRNNEEAFNNAILKEPRAIEFFSPTLRFYHELALEAVQILPQLISHIDPDSKDYAVTLQNALMRDGLVIEGLKEQLKSLDNAAYSRYALTAVRSNGLAFQHLDHERLVKAKQYVYLAREAVNENPRAIIYIDQEKADGRYVSILAEAAQKDESALSLVLSPEKEESREAIIEQLIRDYHFIPLSQIESKREDYEALACQAVRTEIEKAQAFFDSLEDDDLVMIEEEYLPIPKEISSLRYVDRSFTTWEGENLYNLLALEILRSFPEFLTMFDQDDPNYKGYALQALIWISNQQQINEYDGSMLEAPMINLSDKKLQAWIEEYTTQELRSDEDFMVSASRLDARMIDFADPKLKETSLTWEAFVDSIRSA